jgi:hypothetical protein
MTHAAAPSASRDGRLTRTDKALGKRRAGAE